MATYLHLVRRLGMSGTTVLLLHAPSRRVNGPPYLHSVAYSSMQVCSPIQQLNISGAPGNTVHVGYYALVLAQYLNVHQMLKHIVFSQKNAARKKKCMHMAETKQKKGFISFKIGENKSIHFLVDDKESETYKTFSGQPPKEIRSHQEFRHVRL